jgi:hypothetical protein
MIDIKVGIALTSIIVPIVVVLLYAKRAGLLQGVVLEKFATYAGALKFLEEKVAHERNIWKRTRDYSNPIALVEVQKVGSFGEVSQRWILTRHKSKPEWLVTNDNFFIKEKMGSHDFDVFMKSTSGCLGT